MPRLDVPDSLNCALVPFREFGRTNHLPIATQVGRTVDVATVYGMVQGGVQITAAAIVFHMLHGPTGEMRAMDQPILASLVAFKYEGAFTGAG
jgi:hypothetical protein